MNKELSTVLSHSKVYAFGNLLNRGAGIILLPIYVNTLDPSEYGLLALINIIIEILAVFLVMGMGNGLVRFWVDCKTKEEQDLLLSTVFFTFVFLSVCLVMVIPWMGPLICKILFSSQDNVRLLKYALYGLIFTCFFNLFLQVFVVEKKSHLFFYASVSKTIVYLVTNIILVVFYKMGVYGIVYGTVFTHVLFTAVLLVVVFKRRTFFYSQSLLKKLLVYSAPLIPSVFFDTAISGVDRYCLNYFVGTAAVGNYALGERVASLLKMLIIHPFNQIWVVRKFENGVFLESKQEDEMNNVFVIYILTLSTVSLGLILFSTEIINIIAKKQYLSASTLIPIFACAQILNAIRLNFEIDILQSKKTTYIAYISGITFLLSVPLFFLLTKYHGTFGTGVAYIVMHAIRALLVILFTKKITAALKNFSWKVINCILAFTFGVGILAMFFLNGDLSLYYFAIKVIVFFVFFIFLYFNPIISIEERQRFLQFIQRKSK